ncbi:hypothetical protein EV356DRAFT_290767 [Viridothelium virens]|uniref:Uncharacterized protein n=1 Tax=Viridothelium virens TaxID=1048519 RepID=A0A6A6H188_VIRVR|nr:hypothetical protein EV356DRAFT_290767 [Viridothelium virens]
MGWWWWYSNSAHHASRAKLPPLPYAIPRYSTLPCHYPVPTLVCTPTTPYTSHPAPCALSPLLQLRPVESSRQLPRAGLVLHSLFCPLVIPSLWLALTYASIRPFLLFSSPSPSPSIVDHTRPLVPPIYPGLAWFQIATFHDKHLHLTNTAIRSILQYSSHPIHRAVCVHGNAKQFHPIH